MNLTPAIKGFEIHVLFALTSEKHVHIHVCPYTFILTRIDYFLLCKKFIILRRNGPGLDEYSFILSMGDVCKVGS